jgi:acyl dehydratase
MLTFDGFQPGHSFGEATVALDEAMMQRWVALFPQDAACAPLMPEGMAAVMVMNAYMDLVGPRPPGNVHASQQFQLHSLPRIGQSVRTRVTCRGKELRNGRRWIDLETDSRDETGALLFTGAMRLIWAA